MDDSEIIELYWNRKENAVSESSKKYGKYCFTIAHNILIDYEDSEECVNDTWLAAWNSIPPNRPDSLKHYLGKMTRWLSLNRLRDNGRIKRGGGELTAALEELEDTLDRKTNIEHEVELKELSAHINAFLESADKAKREVFLARYWYMASISEICRAFGFSESKVKNMLMRTRNELLKKLREDGLC